MNAQSPDIRVETPVNIAAPPRDDILLRRLDWDMIRDWVDRLPQPWRIFMPLGFFLLGVAATAGVEAHSNAAGSEDRHVYAAIAISAVIASLVVVVADWKLKHELGGGLSDLREFINRIDKTIPARSEDDA